MAKKNDARFDSLPECKGAKNGREWQEYINRLLSVHHDKRGETYQPIPDQTQGDHGLEGFVDETGDGYQAYSGELSKPAKELTKNQKKKIKDDLQKLETYADWWEPLLAARQSQLKKWTLVVPEVVNREVWNYAGEQAALLRSKNLPFISPTFRTYVRTHNDFPEARATLTDPDLAKQLVVFRPASEEQMKHHEVGAPDFLGKLEEKLRKLSATASDADVREQRDRRRRAHLQCENYLTDLLDKFPTHREQLDEFLALKAEQIETNAFADDNTPRERFREVQNDIKRSFQEIATFANPAQQVVLLEGTIAKWLGQCPLDFRS